MNDAVKFLDAGSPSATGPAECQLGQLTAVDPAIRIQNLAPEMAHHFVVNRLTGLHERVRDLVGLRQARTEGNEHLRHRRFSGRNASGQADFQHEFPMA